MSRHFIENNITKRMRYILERGEIPRKNKNPFERLDVVKFVTYKGNKFKNLILCF